MPRKKFCEHPTRHIGHLDTPKVQRSVSLRLATFIRDQYDLDDVNVNGLCAKCHALENKQMELDAAMDVDENINSNDDMSDYNEKEQNSEEEEDANNEDCDDDDDEDDDDDDTTNQDENSGDDSLDELTYQQQEAMEKLSNVFRMLNLSPIHDQ
jgi:hypothetical protein